MSDNVRLKAGQYIADISANRIVGNAATGSKGTYRLEHLPTGTYRLCFDGSNATGGLTLHAFKSPC